MAVILEIKVVPNSGKQRFERDRSGNIKCFLKSFPEKGKANKELVKFLSKKLSIVQEDVAIIKGLTARKKTIKINCDISREYVFDKLGLEPEIEIQGTI